MPEAVPTRPRTRYLVSLLPQLHQRDVRHARDDMQLTHICRPASMQALRRRRQCLNHDPAALGRRRTATKPTTQHRSQIQRPPMTSSLMAVLAKRSFLLRRTTARPSLQRNARPRGHRHQQRPVIQPISRSPSIQVMAGLLDDDCDRRAQDRKTLRIQHQTLQPQSSNYLVLFNVYMTNSRTRWNCSNSMSNTIT